jgi:phosphoribosylglycinamide formyltransferase-1
MVKINSCVFISGKGSNLKSLLNNSRNYNFPINIRLVVSNKKNAQGLNVAKKYSIPFEVINVKNTLYEIKILKQLQKKKITLICLAGYMKILSNKFIKRFNGKIINIHPSLLPKYRGMNTFKRVLRDKEKFSGCSVHYVSNKLDAGKIILQKKFFVSKNETVETLKLKTQRKEYRAFSEAITKIYMTS